MKGRILATILALLVLILPSCQSRKIMNIPADSIDAVRVFQYDFENQEYEEFFYYDKSRHVLEIIDSINSLQGKPVKDKLYTGEGKRAFGFSFSSKENYSFIILDSFLINSNGEFYTIKEEELEKLLSKFTKDSEQNYQLKYVVNHRELSLIDDEWHTEFMLKSRYDSFDNDLVVIEGKLEGSDDDITLKYELRNLSSYELTYGQYMDIETKIGGIWYQINDMTPSGFHWGWNDLGYSLVPGGTAMHEDAFLNYFYPLPRGKYRIIKEFHSTTGKHYVAFEFEM